MKNLDAHYDALLAKHLAEEDVQWTVMWNDGDEGGYLVVDEDGESDGEVYETLKEAKAEAHRKNTEVDDDFYY